MRIVWFLFAAMAGLLCQIARADDGLAETWQERPELLRYFGEAGITGTIVVMDATQHRWVTADSRRAFERFLPASTFKIPNSLIALETGVVRDEKQVFKWDGKVSSMPGWNADQTLTSSFRNSVVWVYQDIARQVGAPRMQHYLYAFHYGNARPTPQIDTFWLDGDLRISAVEQIDFLRRFNEGRLLVSSRSADLLRKVMLREQTANYRLYWKTGMTAASAPNPNLGWFVGWIERDGNRVYFALNADIASSTQWPQREMVTRKVLGTLGYLD